MKLSVRGLNLIKEFEGCQLTAYRCPAGVWTIGYGHTGSVDGVPVCDGMVITEEKATELLKADVAMFENAVNSCKGLTFKPNKNQFAALVSFAYNCGTGSLSSLVNGRDAATVSEKLLLYNKADGQVLDGLVRRRQEEKALFDNPVCSKKKFIRMVKKQTKTKIRRGALKKTVTLSICENSQHPLVLPVQQYLHFKGYYKGTFDGIFGKQMEVAVDFYQKEVLGYAASDGEITAKGRMWMSMLGIKY